MIGHHANSGIAPIPPWIRPLPSHCIFSFASPHESHDAEHAALVASPSGDAFARATCARAGEELGLTMRDGRVTETFAEDDGTARAGGRWITVYAREACARLIDGEHDDALMTFGKRDDGGARMEAREALCHARTGTCESASAARAANELEARDRRDREL